MKTKTKPVKRNKGLSLHGVKFEDAVRAFMQTPTRKGMGENSSQKRKAKADPSSRDCGQ